MDIKRIIDAGKAEAKKRHAIPHEYYCPIYMTVIENPIKIGKNYYELEAWNKLPFLIDGAGRKYKPDPLTRIRIYDEPDIDIYMKYKIRRSRLLSGDYRNILQFSGRLLSHFIGHDYLNASHIKFLITINEMQMRHVFRDEINDAIKNWAYKNIIFDDIMFEYFPYTLHEKNIVLYQHRKYSQIKLRSICDLIVLMRKYYKSIFDKDNISENLALCNCNFSENRDIYIEIIYAYMDDNLYDIKNNTYNDLLNVYESSHLELVYIKTYRECIHWITTMYRDMNKYDEDGIVNIVKFVAGNCKTRKLSNDLIMLYSVKFGDMKIFNKCIEYVQLYHITDTHIVNTDTIKFLKIYIKYHGEQNAISWAIKNAQVIFAEHNVFSENAVRKFLSHECVIMALFKMYPVYVKLIYEKYAQYDLIINYRIYKLLTKCKNIELYLYFKMRLHKFINWVTFSYFDSAEKHYNEITRTIVLFINMCYLFINICRLFIGSIIDGRIS